MLLYIVSSATIFFIRFACDSEARFAKRIKHAAKCSMNISVIGKNSNASDGGRDTIWECLGGDEDNVEPDKEKDTGARDGAISMTESAIGR